MKLRSIVLLFPVAFALSQTGMAQTVSLEGHVRDSQGGVIVGAMVTLSPSAGGAALTQRTNEEGVFSFGTLSPGRYTLQIESPGFLTSTQVVAVPAGMPPVIVDLQISGLIEDVQVSGTAPYSLAQPAPTGSRLGLSPLETPASVSVVPGDVIRDLGTTSLIVAKSLAPGITSSAPMGNGGRYRPIRTDGDRDLDVLEPLAREKMVALQAKGTNAGSSPRQRCSTEVKPYSNHS